MVNKPAWSGAHWWMLLVTAVLFGLVATCVDLKPEVDENFFFSTSDPQLTQSKKIDKRFPSPSELILTVSSSTISSPRYLGRIQKLTQEVKGIDGISAVKSLTDGPKSLQDALASPFWSRLLIAPDHKSSNVLVFIEGGDTGKVIKRLEQIIHDLDEADFRIHLAGPSYVVEMIRRSLTHDFWYFSLTAFVLFGFTMAAMFRSLRVFLGMLATCTSAVLLTLLFQSMLGKKTGILTVNLGTIVFVVALSHLVYMTFNWQTLVQPRRGRAAHDLSGFILVDDLRVSRVRELINCASETATRAGIRRRTRSDRGVRLRIYYVPAVPALGCSAQKRAPRERTAARILDAPVRAAVGRGHSC